MAKKKPYKGKPLSERTKPLKIVYKNDEPMCVARPDNQELAMQFVEECMNDPKSKDPKTSAAVWAALEKKLNDNCGPYTFVGYATTNYAPDGNLLVCDEFGKPTGTMEKGDSFVSIDFFTPPN